LNQAHEDSQSNTHVGNDSIAFQLQSQSSSLMLNQSQPNQNPLSNPRMLEEAKKSKATRFGQNNVLKQGGRNREGDNTNNSSHLNMVFESEEIQ
jgi:hypothetical protein